MAISEDEYIASLELLHELHEKDEQIALAKEIINQAVEIMTLEQLSQWKGVRAWLEEVKR